MCKMFYNLIDAVCSKKTQAHYFQAKSINLYFKNSINPQLTVLSLMNFAMVKFDIQKVEDSHVFNLIAYITDYNGNEHEKNLASFSSKEDAEYALKQVRVTLHMPSKALAKWTSLGLLVLSLIGGVYCITSKLMKDISSNNNNIVTTPNKNNPIVNQSNNQGIPDTSNMKGIPMPPILQQMSGLPANIPPEQLNQAILNAPPPVSGAELQRLIEQLQRIKEVKDNQSGANEVIKNYPQQHQPSPQNLEPPSVESYTGDADKLLKGLK